MSTVIELQDTADLCVGDIIIHDGLCTVDEIIRVMILDLRLWHAHVRVDVLDEGGKFSPDWIVRSPLTVIRREP